MGMTAPTNSTEPSAAVPTTALLGGPPLMRGENEESYDELLARICRTLGPRDPMEEIWIREIVDFLWEGFRLRRLKAVMLTEEARSTIAYELSEQHAEAEALAGNWALGDKEAETALTSALGSAGMSMETLTASAVTGFQNVGRQQQIERMLVSFEARRSAALRELEAHRGRLPRELRLAIAKEEAATLAPERSAA
jgi:hypothetical protein